MMPSCIILKNKFKWQVAVVHRQGRSANSQTRGNFATSVCGWGGRFQGDIAGKNLA